MKKQRPGQRSNSNLKQQFFLKSALLLVGGCLLLSGIAYWNTRRLLMEEAIVKSEVMLQEVEAIRSYVQDELRPAMYDLIGQDTFIIEAMSTTYVSATIMEKFGKTMPEYVYRRASVNPHNPRNLAGPFEEEMFDWFEEDHNRVFWQGIVKKNGEDFFISMVPDYFEQSCIRCHGKVEDAPESLVARYGRVGGFRFKAGDLAGIDSISIPVSVSLSQAMQGSIILLFMMVAITLIWLWLLNRLFQRLVVERISALLPLITEKKSKKQDGPGDELDVLQDSVGSLNQYVQSARKGSSLQPNFIGNYVVSRPVSSGAMSWLYRGQEGITGNRVCLKIGFADVLKNPLYLACYKTEIQLFTNIAHRNLLQVKEQVNDVLVLEELRGDNLTAYIAGRPLSRKNVLTVFSQLCDLLAAFHAQGVVHHDFRANVFFISPDKQLYLTDMGLATSDLLPDPVSEAGLGPQGELMYMAPEQITGVRGDPRSDIYSLGVLLFLATTGSLPFDKGTDSLKEWLLVKEQFSITENDQKILSVEMVKIISKAMAYDVTKRYQWVEDFWEDLER